MFEARALTVAALIASGGALAQGQPGDADFCGQYADTVTTAVEDASRDNPACLNPRSGVHADRQSHFSWCLRTPSDEVQGASVHIRRLTSRCTRNVLPTPEEYGGYAIKGSGQLEQPYGQTRGWEVKAAFAGRLFMYCVASNGAGNRSVSIGVDQAMPGDGRQWQLAVPLRSDKNWQGRLEIDGREPANRAGADVGGTASSDWTIVWLNTGQVEALRLGRQAVLSVGEQDFDFGLAGVAAAITKIEECRTRNGIAAPGAARSTSAGPTSQPAPEALVAPVAQEPANLVESIYRRAMSGSDVLDRQRRTQYLSRQLVRLIEQDELESARRNEPGKLEYSLLSGGQDELVIADLEVSEVSRQPDRASVRVRFRNTAVAGHAPVQTVTYQLQTGSRGWRITNIIYDARHDLLATLTR